MVVGRRHAAVLVRLQRDEHELSARVEEAAGLIQLCREKLSSTELKVKKVVDALAEEEAGDKQDEEG